jgi:hypothetical protein
MPDPQENQTDPRPDFAPTSATPDQQAEQGSDHATDQQPDLATPTQSTQENLADGKGARSQNTGIEGGPSQPRPDQAQTDTELTGS